MFLNTYYLSYIRRVLCPILKIAALSLLDISKSLTNKMESANEYGLKTLLKAGHNKRYSELLNLACMRSLEHRGCIVSLSLVYKSMDL